MQFGVVSMKMRALVSLIALSTFPLVMSASSAFADTTNASPSPSPSSSVVAGPTPAPSTAAYCDNVCDQYLNGGTGPTLTFTNDSKTDAALAKTLIGSQLSTACAAYNQANSGRDFDIAILSLDGVALGVCTTECLEPASSGEELASPCKYLDLSTAAAEVTKAVILDSDNTSKMLDMMSGASKVGASLYAQGAGSLTSAGQPLVEGKSLVQATATLDKDTGQIVNHPAHIATAEDVKAQNGKNAGQKDQKDKKNSCKTAITLAATTAVRTAAIMRNNITRGKSCNSVSSLMSKAVTINADGTASLFNPVTSTLAQRSRQDSGFVLASLAILGFEKQASRARGSSVVASCSQSLDRFMLSMSDLIVSPAEADILMASASDRVSAKVGANLDCIASKGLGACGQEVGFTLSANGADDIGWFISSHMDQRLAPQAHQMVPSLIADLDNGSGPSDIVGKIVQNAGGDGQMFADMVANNVRLTLPSSTEIAEARLAPSAPSLGVVGIQPASAPGVLDAGQPIYEAGTGRGLAEAPAYSTTDIWHANTPDNLFQIVSNRIVKSAGRIESGL